METRKIEFVKEFLKLQSEELISGLEKLLRQGKEQAGGDVEIMPMSHTEFNSRIDKALHDSENDKLIEAKDLIAEIEKWD